MRMQRPGDGYLHGTPDLGFSRYFAMYFLQGCWVVVGLYLLANAYWPSSCKPDGLLKVYSCSFRLPETRGWVEAALLTWLWSTPILVAMDILRRFNKPKRR
ncbi:MAG: hypothetical protein WA842_15370 [Croceibacterium sp.]